jgi:hypothetical protein
VRTGPGSCPCRRFPHWRGWTKDWQGWLEERIAEEETAVDEETAVEEKTAVEEETELNDLAQFDPEMGKLV